MCECLHLTKCSYKKVFIIALLSCHFISVIILRVSFHKEMGVEIKKKSTNKKIIISKKKYIVA